MAALVAICGDLGRKKLTHFVKAALCLPDPGTHVVLWRSRSQYKYTKQKQKEITNATKRVQIMGFMPVTYKDPAYLKDPKVCNIKYRE
ncbi:hypothetical protein GH733_001670 [Mirounga leonina]|nr:hypothetical protein GH733_001670 [Mirounga leonina]